MNSYTAFNLALLGLIIGILAISKPSRAYCGFALRVGFLMLLMVYPWDYFGIRQGSWSYPHAQLTVFLVPLNDIVFMLQCNLITLAVLKPILEPALSWKIQPRAETASEQRQDG